MEREIDARGLACPGPVLRTSQMLNGLKEGTAVIIVDNAAARDNVTRFARNKGCLVSVEEKEGDYHITIAKQ